MRWLILLFTLTLLTACGTQPRDPAEPNPTTPTTPSTPTPTPTPTPPEPAPLVARDDTYGLSRGDTLTVPTQEGVLVNDSVEEGKTLSATLEQPPTQGTLILNADGSFTYTHDGSEEVTDSFLYSASDGAEAASALVSITVDDQTPRPVTDTYTVREGERLEVTAAEGVLANDSDPKGAALSASVSAQPKHGTLNLNPDGAFTYTHDHSETTSDSFGYEVSNGAKTVTMIVALSVQSVDDAPQVTKLELAQTHVFPPEGKTWEGEKLEGYTLRAVGNRAALVLVEVSNDRLAEPVIEAYVGGEKLGEIALNSPDTLPPTEADGPAYSTTAHWAVLEKAWLQPGLELILRANENQVSEPREVEVGAPSSFTMITLPFYLFGLDETDIPLSDVAEPDEATQNAYFARHPFAELEMRNHPAEKIEWPYLIVGPRQGRAAQRVTYKEQQGDGYAVMSGVLRVLGAIKNANGQVLTNTQYYAPLLMANQAGTYSGPGGGLGGGNVGTGDYSYTGIFFHEAGHAYGMPHANDGYANGTYPYIGGSLKGSSWGYDQNEERFLGTFVPSTASRYANCASTRFPMGRQLDDEGRCVKQDPMQSGSGDQAAGDTYSMFSDFNAALVQRYIEGKIVRDDLSPTGYSRWDEDAQAFVPHETTTAQNGLYGLNQKLPITHDVPVNTVVITYSKTTPEASQIYPPLSYTGNLLQTIDPTSESELATIAPNVGDYPWYCHASGCDYTLRVTYADDSVEHIVLRGAFRKWAWAQGAEWGDFKDGADEPTSGESFITWGVNVDGARVLERLELLGTPQVYNGLPENPTVLATYEVN